MYKQLASQLDSTKRNLYNIQNAGSETAFSDFLNRGYANGRKISVRSPLPGAKISSIHLEMQNSNSHAAPN